MNVTYLSLPNIRRTAEHNYRNSLKTHPKIRYKIKEIAGDYYYELMSEEETMQKLFINPRPDKLLKSKQDIEDYIRDNLNQKMPLDGPMLRIYI
jgi:hypothetical protein